MPDEKRPDWLADQQSKEEWMQTRRSMRAVPVAERERPLEDMPSWLAEVQPKKKEWSPVQDRIDAHFAGVRELAERRRRRRERLFKRFRNMVDWTAALVEARNELKAQAAEAKAAATAPLIERPPAAPLPPAPVAPQPPPSKPSQHTPPAWAEVAPKRRAPEPPPPAPQPPVETPRVVPAMRPTAAPPPPPPPPPVHKTPKVVRAMPKPPPPPPSAPVPPPVKPTSPPAPPAAPPRPAAAPPPMPAMPAQAPPPMPAMPAQPPAPAEPKMPAEPEAPEVLEPAAAEPVEGPQSEPAPKPKRKKEKKPRSNPLGAIVVQAKLIQQRREEQRQAERNQIIYAIRRMNDEAYESMLLDFFRRDGYTVYRVDDPASSEADLELHRNNERTLVSIKRRGHQVGQESVRELDKEIATSGAGSAFLFTDGSFTEAAIRVANNSGVTLVDGTMLAELIEELTMSELRERKATARLAKAIGWGKKAS